MTLRKLLTCHPLLTFCVMLVTALLFGLLSFNLFMFIKGNVQLVADYGVQALAEGAFEELLTLSAMGVASLALYLVFKVCEKVLVEHLSK